MKFGGTLWGGVHCIFTLTEPSSSPRPAPPPPLDGLSLFTRVLVLSASPLRSVPSFALGLTWVQIPALPLNI